MVSASSKDEMKSATTLPAPPLALTSPMAARSSPPDESTIIIYTHSLPQAWDFVSRILTRASAPALPPPSASPSTKDSFVERWEISNKYYSATVHFHAVILGSPAVSSVSSGTSSASPVLIYLLPEDVGGARRVSVPEPILAQLGSEDLEISLAVRTIGRGGDRKQAQVGPEVYESFDELGMELVDELANDEDEDENDDEESEGWRGADTSPLAQIINTLQTHLWPGLTLKAPKPQAGCTSANEGGEDDGEDERDVTLAFNTGEGWLSEMPTVPSPLSASLATDPANSTAVDSAPTTDAAFDDAFGLLQSAPLSSSSSLKPSNHNAPSCGFSDSFSPAAGFDDSTFIPPPEDGEGEDPMDLTSTLLSLRALREELGKVEDLDERRVLAGKVVNDLFGDL